MALELLMQKEHNLTKMSNSFDTIDIVGVACMQIPQTNNIVVSRYPSQMILEANMSVAEIDEALKHLSEVLHGARDDKRKKALLELVDALLDAKIEKASS
jgi:hypothetical protein